MKAIQQLFWVTSLLWLTSLNLIAQVDHATGRAQVGMPIYTLSEGKISVPIGLEYDASGIQVSAMASEVGLNWSLNAGGRITRIVRDKPDESVLEWGDNQGTKTAYMRTGFRSEVTTDPTWAFTKDLEPDLFVMNVGSMTVSFVIIPDASNNNKPKAVLVKQNQDLKIEIIGYSGSIPAANAQPYYAPLDTALSHNNKRLGSDGSLMYFKITTPDGLVYIFGEKVEHREYSFSYNEYRTANYLYHLPEGGGIRPIKASLGISCPIAWVLSRIIYPKATASAPCETCRTSGEQTAVTPYQEVTFNYKRAHFLPQNMLTFNKSFVFHGTNCPAPQSILINGLDNFPINLISQLTDIESNNLKVEFNSASLLGSNLPGNIQSIIPDYESGTFTNTYRQDILDATYQNQLPDNFDITISLLGQTISRSNPIKALSRAEALRNIVIVDKITGSKMGFYLHRDYYNDYSYDPQTTEKSEAPVRRLRLLGVYPVSFEDNQIQLLNGTRFNYNGSTLPGHLSPARDHWGYFNGQDNNANSNKTGALELQPYRNPTTLADQTNCTSSSLLPHLPSALTGALTGMTLPEGGTIEYEFELHDCDNYHTENVNSGGDIVRNNSRAVGGLRLKKMTTYNPIDGNSYVKKFTYTKENTSVSSGFLSIWPDNVVLRYENNEWQQSIMPNYMGELQSRFINGFYLTYRRVKEEDITYQGENEVNNGYVIHEFNVDEYEPFDIWNNNQWYTPQSAGKAFSSYMRAGVLPKFSFSKGLPSKTLVYRQDNTLLHETTNFYEVADQSSSLSIKGAINLPAYPIQIETLIPQNIITFYNKIIGYAGNANSILSSAASKGSALSSFGAVVGNALIYAQIVGVAANILNDIANPYDETVYRLVTYNVPIGRVHLSKTIEKVYDSNGGNPVETMTEYFFESSTHSMVTKIVNQYSSNGVAFSNTIDKQETNIRYSNDYNFTSPTPFSDLKGIEALKLRSIIAPIEQVSLKDNKVIDGNFYEYHLDQNQLNNYGNLAHLLRLEIDQPLTPGSSNSNTEFKLSSVDTNTGSGLNKNNNYVRKISYSTYNDHGLPTEQVVTDDPTLKTNVTYGTNFNGFIPTQSTIGVGTSLARSQSMNYSLLFGLTQVTAPDNTFVTNHYDGFGRLKMVKDHQTNILQTSSYIYAEAPQINNNVTISLRTDCGNESIATLEDNSNVAMMTVQNALTLDNCSRTNFFIAGNVGTGSIIVSLNGPGTLIKRITENNTLSLKLFSGGFIPSQGNYQMTASIYSRSNGGGYLISQKKISFTITN